MSYFFKVESDDPEVIRAFRIFADEEFFDLEVTSSGIPLNDVHERIRAAYLRGTLPATVWWCEREGWAMIETEPNEVAACGSRQFCGRKDTLVVLRRDPDALIDAISDRLTNVTGNVEDMRKIYEGRLESNLQLAKRVDILLQEETQLLDILQPDLLGDDE